MAHEKVFAICENKCFEETMTKEQILELTQETSEYIIDPTTGKQYKIRVLSQEEYDALGGVYDQNTLYYIVGSEDISDMAKKLVVQNMEITRTTQGGLVITSIENVNKRGLYTIDFTYSNIRTNMMISIDNLEVVTRSFTLWGTDTLIVEYTPSLKQIVVRNGGALLEIVDCKLITEY